MLDIPGAPLGFSKDGCKTVGKMPKYPSKKNKVVPVQCIVNYSMYIEDFCPLMLQKDYHLSYLQTLKDGLGS